MFVGIINYKIPYSILQPSNTPPLKRTKDSKDQIPKFDLYSFVSLRGSRMTRLETSQQCTKYRNFLNYHLQELLWQEKDSMQQTISKQIVRFLSK